MAILAAVRLNPSATLEQLSLDHPTDLMASCEAVAGRLTKDALERLRSPTSEDYPTYFYGSSKHAWIPKRAGYFLGYRIALFAEKGLSLIELAKLGHDDARKLVERALRGIQRGQTSR